MREEEKTTEGCLQIAKRNVKYILFKFRNIYGHGLILRACPREHQAVVLHATSPISMKLSQFKGFTPKLLRQTGFCVGFSQGEIDHPPVSLGFNEEIASK